MALGALHIAQGTTSVLQKGATNVCSTHLLASFAAQIISFDLQTFTQSRVHRQSNTTGDKGHETTKAE